MRAAMHVVHAGIGEALARERVEIDPPVAGPRRHEGGFNTMVGATIMRDEGITHFLADLVSLRPRRRPQPRNAIRRRSLHRCDRRLQHASGEPLPAGVRRPDFAAIAGSHHHRQTIGGEDGEDDAGRRCHRGVGLRPCIDSRAIEAHHIDAMHLAAFMPDLKPLVANCKFYNCTHLHEPGCGVISAVKSAGSTDGVSDRRYQIYSELFAELSQSKY